MRHRASFADPEHGVGIYLSAAGFKSSLGRVERY